MPHRSPAPALCLCLFCLVGCGSSGSGDQLTVGDVADKYLDLADRFEGTALPPDPNVPTSGSATYSGYIGTFIETQEFGDGLIVGDLGLKISFAGAGDVTGEVDDLAFIDVADDGSGLPPTSDFALPLAGSLSITNGFITRDILPNPTRFQADINGRIELPPSITSAPTDATAQVSGTMNGNFVQGGVRGSIDAVSSVAGLPDVALEGTFAAEED